MRQKPWPALGWKGVERLIGGADPAAPCAVDEEETLLLALKLAQELHRQRHHMKETARIAVRGIF